MQNQEIDARLVERLKCLVIKGDKRNYVFLFFLGCWCCSDRPKIPNPFVHINYISLTPRQFVCATFQNVSFSLFIFGRVRLLFSALSSHCFKLKVFFFNHQSINDNNNLVNRSSGENSKKSRSLYTHV